MKTSRTKKLPPFYTHVIGSLPRPAMVKELLARKDTMSAKEYEANLDDVVRFAIRLQELAGLDVVSDGEWRRRHYVGEFLKRIGGFEKIRPFNHQGEVKKTDVVVRKISAPRPVWNKDAAFLVNNTKRVTKFAIPSPFLIAIRYWHEDFSKKAYPTIQHFTDHLTKVLRQEALALVDAGIDIIQIDDPALTYFCDHRLMDSGDTHDDRLRRHWDIEKQFPQAVDAINAITDGLKAEVHLHCCHSVYKRQSDVHGDYKPILPRLETCKIDRVNIEFAYHGTGAPDDLKLLPANLGVGMGVVDVRGETLQSVEEIEAIGAAGAGMIDINRIALNPDCGFAPDAGEPPTIDEAFTKLSRMCEAAKRLRARFDKPAVKKTAKVAAKGKKK
jgi:5-methyltetrahydropteroyltriglutamate--homocysteine methyltransferase